ncbi:MAG: PAS domain S-box protein [Geobacteraceae bacterium]|nr:PAS domain S-box protein [Geobacteraceae bacterium]
MSVNDGTLALRLVEERYQAIFRNTSAGMVLGFPDGSLIEVNPAFCRFLGYGEEELLQLTVEEITHPDDRDIFRGQREAAQNGKVSSYTYEKRFLRKDGSTVWGQVSGNWSYDTDGSPVYLAGLIQDITGRKRMEEEIALLNSDLASHATELEAVNRELEAFNFSVSHDLCSPLTGIHGYCQLLLDLCGDRLGDQGSGFVREIYKAAENMDELITTMLNFSHLARSAMTPEPVDLTGMAKTVAAKLKMTEPQREVTITVADGIKGEGDAKLLRVVLENLLGNAWKYTGRQETAVIEFGAMEIGGSPAFFVRDNGPGFDMAHSDRLFSPFQRLPGARGFAGHGIGLATVQRIIQRHGGRVWAEGAPGQGAAFYFTL